MRVSSLILVWLVSMLCGCSNQAPILEGTIINLTKNIELTLPEGIEYRPLEGIDSFVGEIVDNNDDSFYIFIDIGVLAGSYVDEDDGKVEKGKSINEDFIFQKRDRQFLDRDGCCYFFTFSDIGPANFVTADNENLERVIRILESLRSK